MNTFVRTQPVNRPSDPSIVKVRLGQIIDVAVTDSEGQVVVLETEILGVRQGSPEVVMARYVGSAVVFDLPTLIFCWH